MRRFDFIPPQQFSLLGTLLGLLFTINLDADEQNAIGNFFVSISQGILTSTAQQQSQKTHNINIDNNTICKRIDCLCSELNELKKQLNKK